MNLITQDRLNDAFRDRIGGFVRDALEDPDVIEVMVNACGRIWLDRLQGGVMKQTRACRRPQPRRSSGWSPITSATPSATSGR
jgi:Flp pilus assembly CpaF family ATPase